MQRLYPTFAQAPNTDTLTAELNVAFSITNAACGYDGARFVEVPDDITLQQAQTVVDAHNPATLTNAQQETTQANTARNQLKLLMMGLHGLSVEDKGYAVYCRLFAWRNGANQATLDGIINRATAAAYITSLPEWTNMTAASRAFMAKKLEADAALCQVLLLVLSG